MSEQIGRNKQIINYSTSATEWTRELVQIHSIVLGVDKILLQSSVK